MLDGLSEHIGLRATIFRQYGPPLEFGLGRQYGEMLSCAWGRTLGKTAQGQAGRLILALPDRVNGPVGTAWSEVIAPEDYVELEVYVHRSEVQDPLGWGRTDGYVGVFSGFVESVSLPTQGPDGEQLTTVTCTDQMGTLDEQHYSYFRNVGAIFKGKLKNEGIIDTLESLESKGLQRSNLEANSIAGAADALFRGLLYDRLGFERKIGKDTYRWDDLHGYLFQSDDFGINVAVDSLAPEGSTWADAVSWVVDAPFFYEFFLENYPAGEQGRALANGGVRDVGRVTQVKRRAPKRVLAGNRMELFVLRPSPFPTYDPERGGYNGAAWDSLPVIESLPQGNTTHALGRSRRDLYSLFSVDIVNSRTQADSATNANAEAQVVGDAEGYLRRRGYRPLDVATKRMEVTYIGGEESAVIAREELARRLAWQTFSWNHFNDRFYAGTITGPLDIRARLGCRYLDEGLLFYIEGYMHTVGADGSASTEWSVTRGLSASAYGIKKAAFEHNLYGRTGLTAQVRAEFDLYRKYLGRQRPGEQHAPVHGSATDGLSGSEFKAGEHHD